MAPRYRGHELCGPGGGLFCVCPAHFHCPPKYPPNKRAVCAAWRIFSLCSLTPRHALPSHALTTLLNCLSSIVCRVACQIHPTNMYLLLAVTPSVTPVRYASSAHHRCPMSMHRPRRRRRRRRSRIYVTLICFRALLFLDVVSRLVQISYSITFHHAWGS